MGLIKEIERYLANAADVLALQVDERVMRAWSDGYQQGRADARDSIAEMLSEEEA